MTIHNTPDTSNSTPLMVSNTSNLVDNELNEDFRAIHLTSHQPMMLP